MQTIDNTQLEKTQTEAGVAAALALAINDPSKLRFLDTPDTPPLIAHQQGVYLQSLENFQPGPHRPTIHVALDTAKDLHAYVTAQTKAQADRPVIFATRDHMTIKAFLDYHGPGNNRWLNHTAQVTYRASHQFTRWTNANGKKFSQENFALFLDEVINDFIQPSGAEVLSFAENLEATSTQVFKSAIKLASGETNLTFTDARDGDISTRIVDEFTIGIPVWQGGVAVQITARLFHRIVDNKDSGGNPTGTKSLQFWFTLRHLEEIKDKLFEEEVKFLETAFNGIAPIYAGVPPQTPQMITSIAKL